MLALALTVSCSDRATDSSSREFAPTTPSTTHAGSTSVFTQQPTVITVPTYDGSGQSVHPDVVEFDQPWHGARYWLTVTPYPKSNQTLENPSILRSDDGMNVSVPSGLTNPVIQPPRRAKDYNSDPELLYEAQSKRLVLFYRLVDKRANTLHVSTSTDGVTWTVHKAPFWERSHQVVSPTIAPRDGGAARMFYVNAGRAGCETKSTRVVTRIASDKTGRIVDTDWSEPTRTDLSIPGYEIWHIKARYIPSKAEYWMLISAFPVDHDGCHTDDLFFARSTDGTHWTVYSEPVMRHEDRDWTAAAVYRSTFLYDAATDEISFWISARGTTGEWKVGFARARYGPMLRALQTGERLSAPPRASFHAHPVTAGDEP